MQDSKIQSTSRATGRRMAALVAVGTVAAGASAFAGPAVFFDLEDQELGTGLTTLTLTDSLLTAVVGRGGQAFDVVDLSAASGTVSLDERTIAPSGEGDAAFTVDFSEALSSFSVQLGDFGDDDDALTLTAFSGAGGTGSVVATNTADLPAVGDVFSSFILSVEGDGIGSVSFGGGFEGDNSVVADSFAATLADDGPAVIPLPTGVFAAMPAGLIALGAWRRARRATA